MHDTIRSFIAHKYPYVLKHTETTILSEEVVTVPHEHIINTPSICRKEDPRRYERFQYYLDDFISTEMQCEILKSYRCIRTVEYKCTSPLSKRVFQINIIYYLPVSPKGSVKRVWSVNSERMRLVETYVKALFIMLFYLESTDSPYMNTVIDKPIQIYFCPTMFQKKITKEVCSRRPEGQPFVFDYDMVNSGYTSHIGNTGYIVIYRYEEFNRLLFHECIHYMGIDGVVTQWSEWQSFRDERLKNVKGELRVFESYADTWAIYWNILLYQFLMSNNRTRNHSDAITKLWKRELRHQRDLIEYCMTCIGTSSIRKWLPNSPADSSCEWIMKTPTFAYYILKHGAFLRGSTLIRKDFPFGATLWSREKMQEWYDFCISGIVSVSMNYRPSYRATDISTTMSAIGFQ
jgi:hypothetical protein